MHYPTYIFSGYHGRGHCQGIAVDRQRGLIYYSFTNVLVKADLTGKVLGSVKGIVGHLGCIDFHDGDGRVYGSLEYKNDAIGRGILRYLDQSAREIPDAFYCAIFDVDKIDRMDMDAEKDGVMRVVYLPDVVEDYNAAVTVDGVTLPHKFGCSGIDGTAWGPDFGTTNGPMYLNICYGIYNDVSRRDNDNQILVQYDAADWWDTVACPLNQYDMHCSGARCRAKYTVFTGNTDWGVQNLEYDAWGKRWLMAVYRGKKPQYPNYRMFAIDGQVPPENRVFAPYGETLPALTLAPMELSQDGVSGSFFRLGATGMADLGDGTYYFADAAADPEQGQYAHIRLYRATPAGEKAFTPVDEP